MLGANLFCALEGSQTPPAEYAPAQTRLGCVLGPEPLLIVSILA